MKYKLEELPYNACPNCGIDDYVGYEGRYSNGQHWICNLCEYTFIANDPDEIDKTDIDYKGIGSKSSSEEILSIAKHKVEDLVILLDKYEKIKDLPFSDEHTKILTLIENLL